MQGEYGLFKAEAYNCQHFQSRSTAGTRLRLISAKPFALGFSIREVGVKHRDT